MRTDERFWSMVQHSDHCWEWRGAVNTVGYGRLRRGRIWGAHRFAWTLVYGDIPNGLHVLHRCDNRRCVRPDHLWLGTHADNMADMAAKHRTAFERHPESAPRGEGHWNARLTVDEVRLIRSRADAGMTHRAIAASLGLKRRTVSDVCSRKSWTHV